MQRRQLWTYACVAGLVACASRSEPGGEANTRPDADAGERADTSDPIEGAHDASQSDSAALPGANDAAATEPAPIDSGASPDAGDHLPLGADAGDALVAPGAPDADVAPPVPSEGCLAGITRYKDKGPFAFKAEAEGNVKLWVPTLQAGCKAPVVHLANGTGASCANYAPVLEHLASHGFLTACYETPNSGPGSFCMTALETAYEKHPELADDRIGFTGHEAGGTSSYLCLRLAEEEWGRSKLYAGHAIEPASGVGGAPGWRDSYAQIRSPVFLFNGSEDVLVSASWVGMAFEALSDTTEAYWYEGMGATHIPIPTRWAQESAVVFFRWKLLGDRKACEYFKAMPMGADWTLQKRRAEQGC